MKFFIDTANTKEIKEAWELGVIDGVTTNPSLISKEKKEPHANVCSSWFSLRPFAFPPLAGAKGPIYPARLTNPHESTRRCRI